MTTNPKCRAAGGSCNCSNADAVSCPDQHATAPAMTTMTEQEQIRVLRNELAIIIGCDDGRSAQEKAGAVIAWIDKHDQRATIQPVAAPEPVAWMRDNLKECVTAESKRKMEQAGFGVWAEIAANYTIPLYTAAPVQAWTALTPEELVMANEAIRQMAHGFMPNTVDLFRRLVAAAPAQVAPDEVTVAWFRQASSFGPWVECKPTDEGATRFNRAALRTTSTTTQDATPADSQKGEGDGA